MCGCAHELAACTCTGGVAEVLVNWLHACADGMGCGAGTAHEQLPMS